MSSPSYDDVGNGILFLAVGRETLAQNIQGRSEVKITEGGRKRFVRNGRCALFSTRLYM